jgi:hypothetical protein
MKATKPRTRVARTYSTHGLIVVKRATMVWGNRGLLDQRTKIGKALAEWRAQLMADLGGADTLSIQQHAVVDLCVRERLMLDSVDAWILRQPGGLIDKRRRAVLPVVRERQQLADALARHLALLGLERKTRRAPALSDYLAQRGASETGGSTGTSSTPNPAGDLPAESRSAPEAHP